MPILRPRRPRDVTCVLVMLGLPSELDLDVDAGGKVESHERVDGLRRRVDDVDESLVRTHLEVLAAVLVLVWRTGNAEHVLLSGQRLRTGERRTIARSSVQLL